MCLRFWGDKHWPGYQSTGTGLPVPSFNLVNFKRQQIGLLGKLTEVRPGTTLAKMLLEHKAIMGRD